MYSAVDLSVTPRPMYPADGRKLPDVYTKPGELRGDLQRRFGTFPLFQFWGPKASIRSSAWIADAAIHVDQEYDPTLSLVYLPHLDYALQRLGPDHRDLDRYLRQIDRVARRLIAHFENAGAEVIVLSEYGITPAWKAIDLNRHLRKAGLLALREELGREYLDAGASTAFAVADHQVAHVYVNDPGQREQVRSLLSTIDGVGEILDDAGKRREGLNHPRAGDFVLVAQEGAWFTYYFWEDDARAPDYARTVDIHRKPGYDPVELFLDPAIRFPMLKVGKVLAQKTLGFRTLMDVIPLDASLVRGSHGRRTEKVAESPLLITQGGALPRGTAWINDTDVCSLIDATLHEGAAETMAI
jgi:predicted AlkP superfamily pyrophosphatase or phosphodiesterase